MKVKAAGAQVGEAFGSERHRGNTPKIGQIAPILRPDRRPTGATAYYDYRIAGSRFACTRIADVEHQREAHHSTVARRFISERGAAAQPGVYVGFSNCLQFLPLESHDAEFLIWPYEFGRKTRWQNGRLPSF